MEIYPGVFLTQNILIIPLGTVFLLWHFVYTSSGHQQLPKIRLLGIMFKNEIMVLTAVEKLSIL